MASAFAAGVIIVQTESRTTIVASILIFIDISPLAEGSKLSITKK
jgi:hypothetical protein